MFSIPIISVKKNNRKFVEGERGGEGRKNGNNIRQSSIHFWPCCWDTNAVATTAVWAVWLAAKSDDASLRTSSLKHLDFQKYSYRIYTRKHQFYSCHVMSVIASSMNDESWASLFIIKTKQNFKQKKKYQNYFFSVMTFLKRQFSIFSAT